jgi:predicted HTH transcriptional regulator
MGLNIRPSKKSRRYCGNIKTFKGALFSEGDEATRSPGEKIKREQIFLSGLPERSMQILEQCREHDRVTMGELTKITDVSRNTVQYHVTALA